MSEPLKKKCIKCIVAQWKYMSQSISFYAMALAIFVGFEHWQFYFLSLLELQLSPLLKT